MSYIISAQTVGEIAQKAKEEKQKQIKENTEKILSEEVFPSILKIAKNGYFGTSFTNDSKNCDTRYLASLLQSVGYEVKIVNNIIKISWENFSKNT